MRLSPSCLIPALALAVILAFGLAPIGCSDSDAGVSPATNDASTPDAASPSSDRGGRDPSGDASDGDDGDAVDGGDGGNAVCRVGETLRDLRVACPGAIPTTPPALTTALMNASAGDIVSLAGLDEGTAPCAPAAVCTPSDAASLLFSDSPESPLQDGVLYADTVAAGHYRFYVYHANGSAAARKFPVVVLNQGTQDAIISIERSGHAAPSTAYVSVGKTVLLDWFTDKPVVNVAVPAGARVLLDPALDALHANKDELVHAIYDVTTSASLKVSFVSVLADADAAAATGALSLLPRDADHQRGTFANADVVVRFTAPLDKGSVRHLRFGGDETDATLTGTDATTGDTQKLLGNYGMFYRVDAPASATSSSFAAVAPRGGSWGGVGSISSGPQLPPSPTALPKNSEQLGTTTDAIMLGALPATTTNEVRLMTGGGSNLPIDLFFVTP